jgi:hypothetical protein
VPRILIADQKQQRVSVCEELRQIAFDDAAFLPIVITGDESWIHSYDLETKQKSSQWKSSNSPGRKMARQMKSKVNCLLVIFFDITGIVHTEFVLAGKEVNSTYYCDILWRLRENVRRLPPELWRQKN